MVTQHALSVPAFLLVTYAGDYLPGREIAHGAMGRVMMCDVKEGPLLERTGSVETVVKLADSAAQYLSPKMQDSFY